MPVALTTAETLRRRAGCMGRSVVSGGGQRRRARGPGRARLAGGGHSMVPRQAVAPQRQAKIASTFGGSLGSRWIW